MFGALETERLCKSVSLVMFVPGEHYVVLFRHNIAQPAQAQLIRGEQGVVLSCRLAESKVRWTSHVLWMAVVSESSVKSSRRSSASSSTVWEQTLLIIIHNGSGPHHEIDPLLLGVKINACAIITQHNNLKGCTDHYKILVYPAIQQAAQKKESAKREV